MRRGRARPPEGAAALTQGSGMRQARLASKPPPPGWPLGSPCECPRGTPGALGLSLESMGGGWRAADPAGWRPSWVNQPLQESILHAGCE